MTYRRLLMVLTFTITVAGGALAHASTERSAAPPNILLIVLDDFGYNDLRANGNPRSPTPNLDALAAQGTRYTRHYADATCSVARAALMTGNYPAVYGIRPAQLGLSVDTPTIASMLRGAGYRTQHIGKWHIVNATLEQSPSQFGFDNWFGFLHNSELGGIKSDGVSYGLINYLNPWLRDNQSPLKQYSGHLTDILTERAIGFLDQQKGQNQPWFLNLWYYAPHMPIQPPPEFSKKYPADKEGTYHALIDHLDSNIGQVMAALDRIGQADNTLVIVLSDNGGTNRETDNNYPYFGKKDQFSEGGLRTPMFMRWPGHIKPKSVSDALVSLYDIFPTIAQASDATPPSYLIGRNLLQQELSTSPQLFWEYSSSDRHRYSILSSDGHWRLSKGAYGLPTLNDLVADPSGKENVLDRNPEIASKLKAEYLQWRKTVRNVDFSYELLNDRGGAILRGNELQRSPGYSGFTFAIGAIPTSDDVKGPQVIAEQSGRWRLQYDTGKRLFLEVLGQTLEGPPLTVGQCSELVVSSHFKFSPINPGLDLSIIDFYVNGQKINSVQMLKPPLLTWGYQNPTYIGLNADGNQPFLGTLSRPVILNERVVPDAQSEKIGDGIADVPRTCS